MVHDLLMPPTLPSPATDTSGINAQAAIDAVDLAAPACNALIVGDSMLFIWAALSFLLAVASIARPHAGTHPDGGTPSQEASAKSRRE